MDAVNEFVAFKPEAVSAFVDELSGPWLNSDPQAFVRCAKKLFDKGAVTVRIGDDRAGSEPEAVEPEHVMVTKTRYEELLAVEAKLTALEAAGVDNWDGYDFAMESLQC